MLFRRLWFFLLHQSLITPCRRLLIVVRRLLIAIRRLLIAIRRLQVQLLVYRSLSNYLLLPWPGLPEDAQQWDARAAHHVTFLKQLFAKFLQLEGSVSALSDNKLLQEEGNNSRGARVTWGLRGNAWRRGPFVSVR